MADWVLTSTGIQNLLVEQIVSRLSLEPEVTGVSWEILAEHEQANKNNEIMREAQLRRPAAVPKGSLARPHPRRERPRRLSRRRGDYIGRPSCLQLHRWSQIFSKEMWGGLS